MGLGLGKQIQEARKSKGLTQKELAQKLGLATGTIQQYELDKRQPRLEQLQAIADALGCDIWKLAPPPRQSTPQGRREIEKLMGKETGYLDGPLPTEQSETDRRLHRIRAAFDTMSQDGQEEATRRVEELSRLPEYQKKESPSLSSLWGFDRRGEDAVDPNENG